MGTGLLSGALRRQPESGVGGAASSDRLDRDTGSEPGDVVGIAGEDNATERHGQQLHMAIDHVRGSRAFQQYPDLSRDGVVERDDDADSP